jgi:hypothetical protein
LSGEVGAGGDEAIQLGAVHFDEHQVNSGLGAKAVGREAGAELKPGYYRQALKNLEHLSAAQRDAVAAPTLFDELGAAS